MTKKAIAKCHMGYFLLAYKGSIAMQHPLVLATLISQTNKSINQSMCHNIYYVLPKIIKITARSTQI